MLYQEEMASARCISKGEYDRVAGPNRSRIAKAPVTKRDYDVCIVFNYKPDRNVMFDERQEEIQEPVNRGRVLRAPTTEETALMHVWREQRQSILKSLQNCGLRLLCFYSRDGNEVFCKIGASAQKLKAIAAKMKYKLQLKPEYLGAHAEYRHDFPGRPALDHGDRRIVSHMYRVYTDDEFHGEDAIFSTRDKICIIEYIINSRNKDCAGLGLGNLLHEQQIKGFFAIHENYLLHDLAARLQAWVMMPKEHANKVRDYFGEKIAFYFLFMSFYWKWLTIPACVGVLLQVLDVIMRTPDNFTANAFCIVSAVSAVMLPHFWRREEAKYALHWGTFDTEPMLEPHRPQYYGELRISPVTGQVEPFYPDHRRYRTYALSIAIMIFCGALMASIILGLLYARHQLKGEVSGGIVTFQFLLAFIVESINAGFTIVAERLTDNENHRTQTDHDLHMLGKLMGLKFVNSYFVLYYIAFLKDHTLLFGTSMTCIRNDCFLDLQAQLAIFTIVRLTVKNALRFIYPRMKTWFRHVDSERKTCMENLQRGHDRIEMSDLSNVETQAKREPYDAFTDFDETLITHGYASFFAVSSPWVCVATMLWVVCELILDMKGITETRQRPFPVRVRGTYPWTYAFELYGIVAVLTNMTLLVFVSDQYAGWRFSEKCILFLYLCHMIYFFYICVKSVFPEIPRSVEMMHMKQEVVVQRCLENIKVEHHAVDVAQLRRRLTCEDRPIDVHESDPTDEHEDEEPQLSFGESWDKMKEGMHEHLSSHIIIAIAVSLGIGGVFALFVFFYNRKQIT